MNNRRQLAVYTHIVISLRISADCEKYQIYNWTRINSLMVFDSTVLIFKLSLSSEWPKFSTWHGCLVLLIFQIILQLDCYGDLVFVVVFFVVVVLKLCVISYIRSHLVYSKIRASPIDIRNFWVNVWVCVFVVCMHVVIYCYQVLITLYAESFMSSNSLKYYILPACKPMVVTR